MASNNNTTRIDVQVNTQNAKNKLRELADEAKKSNIDANRLEQTTNTVGKTSTSTKDAAEEARRVAKELEKEKKAQIADEHRQLRRQNQEEFNERKRLNKSGKLSDEDFEEERKRFADAQMGSYMEERNEKRQVEEEQLRKLEEILDSLRQAEHYDGIQEQRDGDEFKSKGILADLFEKRSTLQSERLSANSEDDINNKTKELASVDKKISKLLGNKSGIADTVAQGGDLMSSVVSGGGMQAGMNILTKLGPWGMVAAATTAAAAGNVMRVGEITKATAPLASLRAQGGRDDIFNSNKPYRDSYHDMGMNDKDMMAFRYNLQMSSGIGSRGDAKYSVHAAALEKGYGIKDVAGLSTFERGDKYGKATSDNIVEMLNVLGQIRDGSIKPNDLTLANEKAQLMYRMQGSYASRHEKIDTKEIISNIAAFEKLGGSGKDWRAGDFIEGAYSGIREGGDKNQMLLKIQAAKEAHPELANNQVALSKIVEKGDDPEYLKSTLKMLKRITNGDEVSQYHLLKKYFPQLNVEQRESMIKNPDFINSLGKKYSNSGLFNTSDALSYAEKNTALTDQLSAWSSDSVNELTEGVNNIVKNTGEIVVKLGDKLVNFINGKPATSNEVYKGK